MALTKAIKIKRNNIFNNNHIGAGIALNGCKSIGDNQPPRNNIDPIAHIKRIFAYSPSQNIAYIIPEYSGMMYAMFWLGEYANILLMCAMGSILFLGGWLPIIDIYPINIIPAPIWMILKILFLFFLFALIKAIVPRYRYDQLMRLGWKIFLPFSLIYLVLTASFLFYFDKLPKGNF